MNSTRTAPKHEHDWESAYSVKEGDFARCKVCGKLTTYARIAAGKRMAEQKRILEISRKHREQ